MPRINLLPWRDELRKQRQKNFGIAAAAAVGIGAAMVWYASATANRFIEHQQARNDYLRSEIKVLDGQIAEIKELESTRDRLINRMRVIDQLQRSRPEIVHLFDELVRTLPEGIYIKSVKQTNKRITIRGVAESNTRVSSYMRALDESEWIENPNLEVIERNDQGQTRVSEFRLSASQVVTAAEPDGETS